MNRTKKLIKNSTFALILQFVTLLAGLITPKLMLDFYGSEINGLISSINQFISYFNLVEAGLASSAIYALYIPLADKSKKGLNEILAATNNYYKASGYIFVSLTLGLALIYPKFIISKELSSLSMGILILILGTSGALEFFTMAKYRALLTADQKQYILSIASMISIILNTILIGILSYLKINIVMLRFICLFSVFSRSLILFIYVKHKYNYINYNVKPNYGALKNRYTVLINELFGTLHFGSPIAIITVFLSLKLVSVYSVFSLIIRGIDGIIVFFVTALSATFGEIVAKKEMNILKATYNEFEFIYYLILSTIYGCVMALIMPFIRIYTANINDTNYNLPLIGFLFVLTAVLANIYTPQAILVRATGAFREVRNQSIVQGGITLILGCIMTILLGMPGVFIASIISNIYRIIAIIFTVQKDILPFSVKLTIKRILRLVICLVIVCISFPIKEETSILGLVNISLDNYLEWFLYAILVGIYISIWVIGLNCCIERKMIYKIFTRIKSILR